MATRTARDPWVVDRVARLTRLRALYESGEPEVSDAEYDRLVDELAVVAPGEKFLRSVGGAVVESSGATLRHAAPMLSLAKETDPTRAATWCTDRDVVLMPKLDGVAVSAVFDAGTGVLVHAATRGDGREGRAISTLVRAALRGRTIDVLPAHEACREFFASSGTFEVRGELVMDRAAFRGTWAPRGFKTARNFVAGLAGRDEVPRGVEGLSLVVYDVLHPVGCARLLPLLERHALAAMMGFDTVERVALQAGLSGRAAAVACLRSAVSEPTYPHDTDGLVLRVNDETLARELGATEHHPRYALAFKWNGEGERAALRDVVWEVARSGAVTPVAVFDPVELDGVTVTRATLHNVARFREFGPTRSAEVRVVRRGGVIPHVEAVENPAGELPFMQPVVCPSCASGLMVVGPTLFCLNTACGGRLVARLVHFATTTGMLGFGPEVVRRLAEDGLLGEPADFYRLRAADVAASVGSAPTSRTLCAEVEKARTLDPAVLLGAMGADGIGVPLARQALEGRTLAGLLSLTRDELEELPGFGPARAESLRALRSTPELGAVLAEVTLAEPASTLPGAVSGPCAGWTVVFTGELQGMTRQEAGEALRALGATIADGVTRATTHLVVADAEGDNFTGKRKALAKWAAKGRPCREVTETEFVTVLALGARDGD